MPVQTSRLISEVTSFFIRICMPIERALNVQSPDHRHALLSVQGMIEIIQALEEKGLAIKALTAMWTSVCVSSPSTVSCLAAP